MTGKSAFATNVTSPVVTADCNGDGLPDIIMANGADKIVMVFKSNPDQTFQAPVSFPTGLSSPTSVATGDFYGDGKVHLVVAANQLFIARGNGDCTFTPQPPLNTNGVFVAVGDVNTDGRPDIVTANYDQHKVTTLLGSGGGAFQAPIDSSLGAFPIGLALGDLNNDGIPDIAVANSSGTPTGGPGGITFAVGDGTGSFKSPVFTTTGAYPYSPIIADLNNDGYNDVTLSTAFSGTSSFSLFINAAAGVGVVPRFTKVTFNLPQNTNPVLTLPFHAIYKDSYGYKGSLGIYRVPFLVASNGVNNIGSLDLYQVPYPLLFADSPATISIGNAIDSTPIGGSPVGVAPIENIKNGLISYAVVHETGAGVVTNNCTFRVGPNSIQISQTADVPAFAVLNTAPWCQWTATADANWFAVAPTSGTGDAILPVFLTDLAGNEVVGSAIFAGLSVPVNRTPFTGDNLLSPGHLVAPSAGGVFPGTITRPSGLPWTVISSDPNISLTPPSGIGSGTFNIVLPPNNLDTKTVPIIAGSNILNLTQTGACPPAFGPFVPSIGSSGGTFSLPLILPSGCSIKLSGTGPSITFPGGTTFTGNSTAQVNVPPNTTPYPLPFTVTAGTQVAQFIQKPANPIQLFTDVPLTDPNVDYINLAKITNITGGCDPSNFCPESIVTRGQMAVFIIRAKMGDIFSYTQTPFFQDVPESHPYFKFIQKMRELRLASGCTETTYCPDATVTRGEGAAFVIQGKYGIPTGAPFIFPGDQYFTDVPLTHPFYNYIQQVRAVGISNGCSTTQYCPDTPMTRGQLMTFIVRAFFP